MLPGMLNLRNVSLDDGLGIGDLLWREPGGSGQVNNGYEPELGLTIGVRRVRGCAAPHGKTKA